MESRWARPSRRPRSQLPLLPRRRVAAAARHFPALYVNTTRPEAQSSAGAGGAGGVGASQGGGGRGRGRAREDSRGLRARPFGGGGTTGPNTATVSSRGDGIGSGRARTERPGAGSRTPPSRGGGPCPARPRRRASPGVERAGARRPHPRPARKSRAGVWFRLSEETAAGWNGFSFRYARAPRRLDAPVCTQGRVV